MPYITVGKENSGNIDLYYEDHGAGTPVVLIHGYPLSGASWEKQMRGVSGSGPPRHHLRPQGFRQVQPAVVGLQLRHLRRRPAQDRDQARTPGFRAGRLLDGRRRSGALSSGSTDRKASARRSFISGVPPFLLKTPDNPEGVDGSVFDGIQKAVAADRYAFFTEFFKNFYNTDELLGKRVSEQVVQASWNIAAGASPTASLACVPTWHEDFRKDLAHIDVPTLVIHGDADRIVPISASGQTDRQSGGRRPPGSGARRAALHHLDARRRGESRTGQLPCRRNRPARRVAGLKSGSLGAAGSSRARSGPRRARTSPRPPGRIPPPARTPDRTRRC